VVFCQPADDLLGHRPRRNEHVVVDEVERVLQCGAFQVEVGE
jgi:hypothetical protein